jgi:branched-subunit amino acid aminotransferase/4-amino-4-deoxychorismate lyase
LFAVDEIFSTGNGSGISLVIEINGRLIRLGEPGTLTLNSGEKYKEVIESSR